MSPTPTTFPRPPVTLESAFRTFIAGLSRLKAPPAPGMNPTPGFYDSILDHMCEVKALVDNWTSDVGFIVSDNAPMTLDIKLFDRPFSDALEGNALWELERAAMVLRDEHREVA